MPVASMTGFGNADGEYESFRWTWELRSVNGQIEYLLKQAVQKRKRSEAKAERKE